MQHIKTYYIYKRFCYSILGFVMIVCPYLSMADQHDTGVQLEVFPYRQTVLGFLLIAILLCLVGMIWLCKKIYDNLNNVKHKVDRHIQDNYSLRQDLSNVNKRIQIFTQNFDSEVLYQKLAQNESNTQEILNLIKPITSTAPSKSVSIPTETTETSEQNRSRIDGEILSQSILNFCSDYNAAIKDRQKWKEFLARYNQNYKIDVTNAEGRRLKPQENIDPIFKTTNHIGCYLACYIEAEKSFAVVPSYDLVVEHSTYTLGAFGEVFECSQFDERRKYQITKLIEPAIFKPDDPMDTWTLKKKGMLELQET